MEELIFVSIASYRDSETQATVDSLIGKAGKPDNLRIVVIEQNDKSDTFYCKISKNVRVLRNIKAKGPAWARFLASTLWGGEKWYLQIDSHMKFVKNWDLLLLDEMKNIHQIQASNEKNPKKTIITCYPPPQIKKQIIGEGLEKEIYVSSITQNWYFDSKSHIIARGNVSEAKSEPVVGYFVSAGFMFFGAEDFLRDIPYDPKLQYLFQGEEILLSARLFTRGWTLYHPRLCVCSHDYTRNDKPKIWENDPDFPAKNTEAVRRYRYLTHQLKCGTPEPNIFGEGRVRTIQEWKQKINLSPEHLFD